MTKEANDLVNIDISSLVSKSTLLIKGSESFIYNSTFLDDNTLLKERRLKKYRNFLLDLQLRQQRLRIEARMIKSALKSSILVPAIYTIDISSFSIQIEEILGTNLGILLFNPDFQKNRTDYKILFSEFGEIVRKLHDIDIIHGDLTPYNLILDTQNKIHIIDFGLSYFSSEIKDKAMDLFILFGSFKIFPHNEDLFDMFLDGYKNVHEYGAIIEIFYRLTNKGRYK